jgi:hypothetical protein
LAEESGLGCEGACACSESIACNAKSGPKAQRRRVLALWGLPGVPAAVCAALVAKEGRPVSVGQGVAWSLCAALQAAEVRGAPWVTRGTGVTELRGASWPPQALHPPPPSLPPHHNPQPTTHHTYFDAAVGGLGQAVRQQQRHGHGRGCC